SETNHVLRVEKGFISLGHEVDGKIDPIDLGLGWVIDKGKKDFIGKRAMELNRTSKLPRKELVGLISSNPHIQFAEGSPLVASDDHLFVEGHVTASVWSEINQQYVALALLDDGRSRMDEKVNVRNLKGIEPAEVTKPCFYDPKGKRLRS
ncbi:MAG: sarcosine oxidase subunit alpha, partial [Rhodobacteraceae bacterium]|nr:sarcosine oxidase subunit alpha [Paracoccaceae bacterium]